MRAILALALLAMLVTVAVLAHPAPPDPPPIPRLQWDTGRSAGDAADAAAAAATRARARRIRREVDRRADRSREEARALADRRALTRLGAPRHLSAYGGYVAWRGNDAITVWRAGALRRHPAATSADDVDLGPDAAGRAVAVFPRCAPRCRIHQLDLATGAQRRIDIPGLPRDDLTTRPGARIPRLYLYRAREHRLIRLRAGRPPRCEPAEPDESPEPCTAEVESVDLGARLVAFVWRVDDDEGWGIGANWELRLTRLADRRSKVRATGYISGTCGSAEPSEPNVAGDRVVFLEHINNCDARAGGQHSFVSSAGFTRLRQRRAQPPPVRFPVGQAYALARDRGVTYWLYGDNEDDARTDNPCAGRGCPLLRSTALRLRRVPSPDPLLAEG